ncbi:MAG: FixH family protein [Hyphomonadaceae bacterium]|nr:FixH family protein [Hyphomonadaceae bacterium]
MSAARAEIRGWHVLAIILAFFSIIIAVNVTFAIYAVRSFPGEDVQRSYLQGLHYNNVLAERRAQAAQGWRATAALREDPAGAVLEVWLTSRDVSIDGAMLSGILEWPTSSQFDRPLNFESLGDGRYVARLGEITPGRWRLRARAESAVGALDFESELTWRSR